MILSVFKNIRDRLSVSGAYQKLLQLFVLDLYAGNKATGSLRGAVDGGTIFLSKNIL